MKALVPAMGLTVAAILASPVHAGIISSVAYGAANAAQAEQDFFNLSTAYITETFDGSLTASGSIGSNYGSNDQSRWLDAADSFQTSVGTFSMTAPEVGAGGMMYNLPS